MTTDDFVKLKSEIAGDLEPVKPLAAPGVRALLLASILLVYSGVVLLAVGLRPDYAELGFWGAFGLASLQLTAACFLFWIGLRSSIPGMTGSRSWPWAAGILAAALFAAASVLIHGMSPSSPPEGKALSSALACVGAIAILGIGPLVLGFFLAVKGLPLQWGTLGLTLGLGSGLVVEALWRLYCPISSWDHIFPAHAGGILLLIAWSFAAVWYWRSRGVPGPARRLGPF